MKEINFKNISAEQMFSEYIALNGITPKRISYVLRFIKGAFNRYTGSFIKV